MKALNEFLLKDRLQKIREIDKMWDLEKNAYISFSGGKDSCVLSSLIDKALPHNTIPRVFCNTGIEYNFMVDFVKEQREKDNRIIIITPKINIREALEKHGYPFKSKEHSHHLHIYQNSGMTKSVKKYLKIESSNKKIVCPQLLKYQFSEDFKIKVSERCCDNLKKQPLKKWAKENNKTISIIGVRTAKKGQRTSHTECTVWDKDYNLIKFKPINPMQNDFMDEYVERENLELCKLYKAPYNFKKSGCKGCPFSFDLKEQLEKMEKYLPNEKKQCELLWGQIYEEYRKIGFRL